MSPLERKLRERAISTFPFPPNPFCSHNVSTNLVREALDAAGYTGYKLFVHPSGIYIEAMDNR